MRTIILQAAAALSCVLCCLPVAAVEEPTTGEAQLVKLGIEPSVAGVRKYLESLVAPDEAEVDRLIVALADEDFPSRDRASHRLANLGILPLAKLQSATKSLDPERAWRAKRILTDSREGKESPFLLPLQVVREKQLAVGLPLLLKIRAATESPVVQGAVLQAMLAIVRPEDRATAAGLLKDADLSVRNTGRRLLARLDDPNGTPLLEGVFEAVNLKQGGVAGGGSNLIAGWEFKPSASITVTHLGIFDHGANGLSVAHKVAIWNIDDPAVPVAAATVPAGKEAPLAGTFRMVPIDHVRLTAGTRYAVIALYPDTSDPSVSMINPSGLTIEYATHLECLGRRYAFPHQDMAFPRSLQADAKHATHGPSFRYEVSAAVADGARAAEAAKP